MKKHKTKKIVVIVVAIVMVMALVCIGIAFLSSQDQETPEADITIDTSYLDKLVSDGKVDVVYSKSGYVRFIDGTFSEILVNSSEDALIVLNKSASVLGSDFEPDISDISYQVAGNSTGDMEYYYKYTPTVNGVKVIGDQVIISTNEKGKVTGLYSTYDNVKTAVDTVPTIDEKEAAEKAWTALFANENVLSFINECIEDNVSFDDIVAEIKASIDASTNMLIYAASDKTSPALVYSVTFSNTTTETESIENCQSTEVYTDDIIDPLDEIEQLYLMIDVTYYIYANGNAAGEIYLMTENIQKWASVNTVASDANGNRREFVAEREGDIFRLRDTTRNIETYKTTFGGLLWMAPKLPGKMQTFTKKFYPTAVSVHANISEAYEFYYHVLGRKSFDGKGAKVISSYDYDNCNFIFTGDYKNACWKPDAQQFCFGDEGNFGSALDVVGHEFTHAVIQYVVGDGRTTTLTYEGESGALNESYADIMGALIEGKTNKGLWTIGEDSDEIIRNMADPEQYDQPEHYKDRYKGDRDHGGVHTNSGIFNHAAYLMMTDSRASSITKESWAKVFYRSMFRLTCDAKFADARNAIINSAKELGFKSSQIDAIKDAFDAVGIHSNDTTEDSAKTEATPTPPAPSQTEFETTTVTTGQTEPETTQSVDVDALPESQGLEFTLNSDGKSYSVTGIGTCSDQDVVIPAKYNDIPVTNIKEGAFYHCLQLKSIFIPDSVTTIDVNVGIGCTNLTSITISNSVTNIGNRSFTNTPNLENILVNAGNPVYHSSMNCLIETTSKTLVLGCKTSVIPTDGSVTNIGEGAFFNCSSLISIRIPDGVTVIDSCAFMGCTNLNNVTMPNGIIRIGVEAFFNCSSLTSINIPKSVTSIGMNTFALCSSLTSISIPDGVESIGKQAFFNCSSLISIIISDSLKGIKDAAFDVCDALKDVYYAGTEVEWNAITIDSRNECLTNATIHFESVSDDSLASQGLEFTLNSDEKSYSLTGIGTCTNTAVVIPSIYNSLPVTSIGEEAFYRCKSFTSVTIPDSVTSIDESAFSNCSSLTNVAIGNSVTSIGYKAFFNCRSLISVIIPDSVTSIGIDAFSHCGALISIFVENGNPIYHSSGNCIIETQSKTLVHGCKKSVIPNDGSVTSIGDHAFSGCYYLKSIIIPDSVISIGDHAFSGCYYLPSVIISDSVISIGDDAFSGCLYLTGIIIPDSVISIGDSAFFKCSRLTSVTIGNSVTSIGDTAFKFCKSLTSIVIPDSVTSMGEEMFEGCTSLASVTIGNGVTSIGYRDYYGCTSLTSITIPDSVTSIGEIAFSGCSKLIKNEYDNGYYLGNENNPYLVFLTAKSTSIVSCQINSNTRFIHSDAFEGCTSLTSITIPNSVTSIGSYAFLECSRLTSVTIGNSVTSIGSHAFLECSRLTSVTIGNSVTSIGYAAFSYCPSLTSVTIPESVTSIGDFAFDDCPSLTNIYYAGTAAEWKAITIGYGNKYLLSATIHYNS